MASEFIKAVFKAEESISRALDDISESAEITGNKTSDLDRGLQQLAGAGMLTREAFDELRESTDKVSLSAKNVDEKVDGVENAFHQLNSAGIQSEEALDNLNRSINDLLAAGTAADKSVDQLERGMENLRTEGQITDQAIRELRTAVGSIGATSVGSSKGIKRLARMMTTVNIATEKADESAVDYGRALQALNGSAITAIFGQRGLASAADDAEEEISEAGRAAAKTSAQLAGLNAIATTSVFSFSSLSVNIGPFNLALRNILSQLPAILAGMGTMLAIVTALAGAFLVLGGVLGALVVGGALAFFEDFSKQFEDSAEAIEALTGALRDLFTEALEPLMTGANEDLFVNVINGLAELVNRFAQFAAQMREPVMELVDNIDADVEGMFEAMHDSFIILMPILEGIIEFFLNDFPDIMVMFSQLTDSVSGDILIIIKSFGRLVGALFELIEVVLVVLAPVLSLVLGLLTLLIDIFNAIPNPIAILILLFGTLAASVWVLVSAIAGMVTSIAAANAAWATHITEGTLLGAVYGGLTDALKGYVAGEYSLIAALKLAISNIRSNLAAHWANAKAKAADNLATRTLKTAVTNLKNAQILQTVWTWLNAKAQWVSAAASNTLAAAKLRLSGAVLAAAGALGIASAVMAVYTTIAGAAAAVTTVLAGALGAISLPVLAVVGAIAALIGIVLTMVQLFTDLNPLGWLIDAIKTALGLLGDLLGGLMDIIGLGGGPNIDASVTDTDDIQTDPNVDLSFEDKLEQNVDVQADPEEKEQMRRVVKDAMNEANSIARRTEGAPQ